jgi:phage tail-like protein
MAAIGARRDPFANFNFLVKIDGITFAGFHECTGYSSTIELIEHREGGAPNPVKLPGLNRYGNVVLRRGMTLDRELYDWHRAALNGEIDRRSGSIVVLDRRGQEQARFNFFEAWPQRMTGPALNSEGTDVAIEEFELAVERLERG